MDVLLGIGNEMRGDDGVGPYIAQSLKPGKWKAIDCGTVPENYTKDARGANTVLIVDATDMGLEPGSIRIIPRERIGDLAISTHSMPLSMLIDYLKESCGEIIMIGIQPKQVADFIEMSDEVKK